MTFDLQELDLGRSHRPTYWSLASGLRVSGASAWAGGLPLTLYAVLGLVAIFVLVTLLSHRRAGIAAALVAGSAPLYSARACRAVGHVAGMSAIAIAIAGLGVAALGRTSRGTRFGALGVGILGCALGWLVSGLVGVALPVTSVALTWLLTRWPGRLQAGPAALLWIVLAAALLGAGAIAIAQASVGAAAPRRSFDFALLEIGLGFFPWSAALPFAIAAMAQRPVQASQTEQALRVLLLLGASLAYAAASLSSPASPAAGAQPCVGLTFLAGAVGLWLWDIERGARVSPTVCFSLALLVTLLTLDFVRTPAKRMLSFAPGATSAELGLGWGRATPFWTSLGLVLCGTFITGLCAANEARPRSRWQAAALFAGSLLAALVLRFGYSAALGSSAPCP